MSQHSYWANHDKLYPGRSSKSEKWKQLKQKAKTRDGWRCVRCGSKSLLQVDHITPLSQGGANLLSNLQTLCKKCHEKKTGRPLRDWREGKRMPLSRRRWAVERSPIKLERSRGSPFAKDDGEEKRAHEVGQEFVMIINDAFSRGATSPELEKFCLEHWGIEFSVTDGKLNITVKELLRAAPLLAKIRYVFDV